MTDAANSPAEQSETVQATEAVADESNSTVVPSSVEESPAANVPVAEPSEASKEDSNADNSTVEIKEGESSSSVTEASKEEPVADNSSVETKDEFAATEKIEEGESQTHGKRKSPEGSCESECPTKKTCCVI